MISNAFHFSTQQTMFSVIELVGSTCDDLVAWQTKFCDRTKICLFNFSSFMQWKSLCGMDSCHRLAVINGYQFIWRNNAQFQN